MATVLVIDHSADIRRSLQSLLEHQSHRVEVASHGTEGLRLVKKLRPDLVVTDVLLPDLNGYELARQVRSDPATCCTPVVLTTAVEVDQAMLRLATSCGVSAVMAKPSTPMEIMQVIDRALVTPPPTLDWAGGMPGPEAEQLRVLSESLAAKIDELNAANERLLRSEDRFRTLLELAPAAIVGIGTDGRIRLVNALAAASFGYTRAELAGRPIASLVPDLLRDIHFGHRVNYVRVPGARQVGAGRDMEARRKDGGRFPVTVSLSIVGDGDDPMVLAAVLDITDRVRQERERARLEASLAQAERLDSVGQLAGGIAHDFNNLLAVIINYAEFVFRAVDPEIRDDVAPIQLAAKRAADLVRQLLLFSRGQPAAPQLLLLNEVLGDLRELLGRTIGEHITMTMELAPATPPVLIDRSKLEQVMVNLVVNARDAMPKGGPIDIETDVVEFGEDDPLPVGLAPGRYARLKIRDAGSGMSETVQDQAFDPFFTTKPRGQGTGLGLATVYGIVTEAGGHVKLSSQVGRGTEVCVLLPAATEDAEQVAPGEPHPVHIGQGETVIVVEDEAAVLGIARRILERNRYVVLPARSPSDALAISDGLDEPPALVLSDVVMPGMSGPELIECLRVRWPEMPALLMSGYAGDEARLITDFEVVGKPFTEAELLTRVHAALRDER